MSAARGSTVQYPSTGTKAANVRHIRDGKVTRLALYFDHERALADLRLSPEGCAPGPAD